MHFRVKKLNLDIFTHVTSVKTLPQDLTITLRQREITHLPKQWFLENLLFPSTEREGDYDLLYQNLLSKYNL